MLGVQFAIFACCVLLCAGVGFSRIGLWTFDLSVTQLNQDLVPSQDLGECKWFKATAPPPGAVWLLTTSYFMTWGNVCCGSDSPYIFLYYPVFLPHTGVVDPKNMMS